MWTTKNRRRYDRSRLRYPSDLTDDEWGHVEPLIPPAKRGGNKRRVDLREVMNGIMYVLSTGCQWRAVPKDLPPRSTLFDYLNLWSWDWMLDLSSDERVARQILEVFIQYKIRPLGVLRRNNFMGVRDADFQ